MGIAWDPAASITTTMNTFLFFSSLIAFARAGTVAVAPAAAVVGNAAPFLVRAPAHDSASIEHHRLGGNFAYSTAEAHAFAEVVPQISTLTHPVAETTHTHIPAPIATHQPAPIVHETRTHTVQAVSQAVHTPVHAVSHVPVAAAAPVAVAHAAPVAHAAYAAAPIAHAAYAGYAGAPIAHGAYAAAPVAVAAAPAVVA